MSTCSEMEMYSDLESGADLKSHPARKAHAKCSKADSPGPLIFRLRDESVPRIPETIGDNGQLDQPIAKPEVPDKKGKTGKSAKSKKTVKIKGRRGIDTLLRNVYRAQLEMLSLAAVKANIMISLNGLLMSMLIISGAHFISIDIWFSIPIALFLLSIALATIFAVLAARPDVSSRNYTPEDFKDGRAH